ncbi:bifunctional hydroxymethylpyrimidine kinase/phosphomethylpyrimidine kinase [Quadrisphaera sp. DSM 44207]|uniref:bifunctional hydroxymethylpyrimidine kinase/phosphomethylpyrimidine kinase n=1 Tax=Quadrisphaera sp. DSM 44207 TaxID=1881057 RepID=UPI00089119F8|nr:bifunctional hydroxymethylpyrimidine kinase/phosphomethylpyrimidine kinase [Quadrisphaera sp. DSM 44207]SDQ36839.1 hydroxymethylpyrimidine/phosphomethylpyrimidine kinase [Quadrisphaera sp. DSM 44207]
MTAVALSVAGSDPSGGAGIQADLKTFSALGAYGTAVLTALTAQSTRGVSGVHVVPADFVRQQLETLLDDVAVHAAKTGMLATAEVVRAVAQVLRARDVGALVVDPVMVATSGDRLLDAGAVDAVREELLPLADVLTPNAPEAAVLLERAPAASTDELLEQAHALRALGPRAVLLKGGHLGGEHSVDVLATAQGTALVTRPRVATSNTHGTGCALAAALTALAATRRPGQDEQAWYRIVEDARDHLHEALLAGADLGVGSGHGPVHTLARWWR